MSELQIIERPAADAGDFAARFAAAPAALRHAPYDTALTPAAGARLLMDLPGGPPRAFWLAVRGDAVVGRIGANLLPSTPGAGAVGFFETDPHAPDAAAVAARLLDTACAWLAARGATTAYGPMDLTTWFPYRFRVPALSPDANEHDEAPFAWEPDNPPEYAAWFQAHGFVETERFHSHGFQADAPGVAEMIVGFTGMAHEALIEKGFRFRLLDESRLDLELPLLYRLTMESFVDNLLFEPIAAPVFEAMYRATADRVDYRLSHVALDAEGREAGFVFAFLDRGYAVVKTIAVTPAFRRLGLSTALLHLVLREGLATGARRGLSALVRGGSRSQFLEGKHAMVRGWRHEYALYRRAL